MSKAIIVTLVASAGFAVAAAPASSQADFNCSDFAYQEDAQAKLLDGDPYHLDQDGDGVACQSLPHRGSGPATAPSQPTESVDCSDFAYQEDAQAYLLPGDPHHLDADRDGVACQSLPRRSAGAAPAPRSAPAPAAPRPGRGRVERVRAYVTDVVDGDTLHVRTVVGRHVTVRLIGIDTPETRRPGTPVECGGRQATAAMAHM